MKTAQTTERHRLLVAEIGNYSGRRIDRSALCDKLGFSDDWLGQQIAKLVSDGQLRRTAVGTYEVCQSRHEALSLPPIGGAHREIQRLCLVDGCHEPVTKNFCARHQPRPPTDPQMMAGRSSVRRVAALLPRERG
jgi:hypothetical protein